MYNKGQHDYTTLVNQLDVNRYCDEEALAFFCAALCPDEEVVLFFFFFATCVSAIKKKKTIGYT